MKQQDLVIIGGGIMGLFTAYYASNYVKNITILEKRMLGNKQASSFSFTRSIRNDYLDPFYARLAFEAQQLWITLQRDTTEKFFMKCGCLNIAKTAITPLLEQTYAYEVKKNLQSINFSVDEFNSQSSLSDRFPQFIADYGSLDSNAGFLYLPPITRMLIKTLRKRNIRIEENVSITNIRETSTQVRVTTKNKKIYTKQVAITAGIWTNEVLSLITGNALQFPIRPDKPQECKYFLIPEEKQKQFLPDTFPVFAYLDVGIYGHPIFDRKKNYIKIGYYNPPDVTKKQTRINSVNDFVKECLPSIQTFPSFPVTDADQCSYDLVADDNFILGKLPTFQRITVGTGWRGTGYKFSPWVGKTLSQLAINQGTVYDIQRFNPGRFILYEKTN